MAYQPLDSFKIERHFDTIESIKLHQQLSRLSIMQAQNQSLLDSLQRLNNVKTAVASTRDTAASTTTPTIDNNNNNAAPPATPTNSNKRKRNDEGVNHGMVKKIARTDNQSFVASTTLIVLDDDDEGQDRVYESKYAIELEDDDFMAEFDKICAEGKNNSTMTSPNRRPMVARVVETSFSPATRAILNAPASTYITPPGQQAVSRKPTTTTTTPAVVQQLSEKELQEQRDRQFAWEMQVAEMKREKEELNARKAEQERQRRENEERERLCIEIERNLIKREHLRAHNERLLQIGKQQRSGQTLSDSDKQFIKKLRGQKEQKKRGVFYCRCNRFWGTSNLFVVRGTLTQLYRQNCQSCEHPCWAREIEAFSCQVCHKHHANSCSQEPACPCNGDTCRCDNDNTRTSRDGAPHQKERCARCRNQWWTCS